MLLTTSLDGEASFSLLVVKYWINNNEEWFIKISTKFKATVRVAMTVRNKQDVRLLIDQIMSLRRNGIQPGSNKIFR